MSLRAFAVCLVLALASSASAQLTAAGERPPGAQTPGASPQMPARDRPSSTKTGVVRGRVIDAATGAPIRRALVGIAGGREHVSAQTDAEGRFELREVPAGKQSRML
jgi:hypothetical protein